MSREEVEGSIAFVLNKTIGLKPKILNFSHPKFSQMENFLGCYTNAAISEKMTGQGFYDELTRFMFLA